ncbi:hypothetical protein Tco_0492850 [Tanacetum coccineum]
MDGEELALMYGKIGRRMLYVVQPLGFLKIRVPLTEKFLSQDKYVDEILKKYGFSTMKTTSIPMETSKPLLKDGEGKMLIFRYFEGQPKLGLWYPKDSPFDLEAYTDSDYAGASLDRKSTIGGASQVEDSDGISDLPTTKFFEQLAIMGQEYVVPQPRSPTHTNVANKATSTGVDVRLRGATTTVTGLEAGQGSGNIDKTPTMPHDLPLPRVHTLRSDEGIMQHNELMDLVTKLSDRFIALETDLTQTKKVYGATFTKLIKRVKRLEKKDKLSKSRRKLRLVLSDEEVTTAGAEISTANPEVKTAGDFVDDIAAESLVYIRRSAAKIKDKGKDIMEESESAMTKTKRQQEQERLGYEATLRLQEQLNKEERQRIARAHKAASSFNIGE